MTHILFHRHTPWQSEVRCSTNVYAGLFLRAGFEISYMQGLVHVASVLGRRGQWHSWARGARQDRGAWVFTPMSLVPYSARWPFNTPAAAHWSYQSCLPSVRRQLRRGGYGEPDLIWSANPGSIALRRCFPRAHFVFQVVDFYPAFAGRAVHHVEREDYRGADHILVIGHALRQYIVDEHGIDPAKITVLGQGVFLDDYAASLPVPTDIASLPRPLGIWVGVVAKADEELFRAAAAALHAHGGSLVLIGPQTPWSLRLSLEGPNVHTFGPRASELVPAYLSAADVGLMLYDRTRGSVYRGQNPLKLYEFAAAGLSIVSTPHDEYEYLRPPALIVHCADDVRAAVDRALLERDDLRRRSLEFAALHSWRAAFARARCQVLNLLGTPAENAAASAGA